MSVPIRIIGPCRVGKWFGCKAPFSADILAMAIELALSQEVLTISVQPTSFPPGSLIYLNKALTKPENNSVAVVHWPKLASILVVTRFLEEAIGKGFFRAGQNYVDLVRAIEKLGLAAIDIDWRT